MTVRNINEHIINSAEHFMQVDGMEMETEDLAHMASPPPKIPAAPIDEQEERSPPPAKLNKTKRKMVFCIFNILNQIILNLD